MEKHPDAAMVETLLGDALERAVTPRAHDAVADQIEAALQPLRDRFEADKAGHADALRRLDNVRFREQVGGSLIKVGANPKALSYLLDHAAEKFEVIDGEVRTKPGSFSSTRPGVPLPIDEWVTTAKEDHAFAFTKKER